MPSLHKASLLSEPPTLHGILPPLALLGILCGVIVVLHDQADGLSLMPVHPGHGTAAAPKDKALGTSPEKRKRNRGPARFFHFSPTGQVLSSIHSVAPQLRWIWRKQPAAGRAVEAQESWELGECFPQSPAPNSLRVSATVLTAPVFSTALAWSPAGLHQELG